MSAFEDPSTFLVQKGLNLLRLNTHGRICSIYAVKSATNNKESKIGVRHHLGDPLALHVSPGFALREVKARHKAVDVWVHHRPFLVILGIPGHVPQLNHHLAKNGRANLVRFKDCRSVVWIKVVTQHCLAQSRLAHTAVPNHQTLDGFHFWVRVVGVEQLPIKRTSLAVDGRRVPITFGSNNLWC